MCPSSKPQRFVYLLGGKKKDETLFHWLTQDKIKEECIKTFKKRHWHEKKSKYSSLYGKKARTVASTTCWLYAHIYIKKKTGTQKTWQDKPLQRRWVWICYHIIFFRLLPLISLCMAITTDKVLIFCFKVHTRHTRNKLKQGKCQS